MKDLFKSEDFNCEHDELGNYYSEAANTKLNAYIQTLEKVYGDIKLGSYHGIPLLWSVDEKPDSTHSVRLIGVETIKTTGPE